VFLSFNTSYLAGTADQGAGIRISIDRPNNGGTQLVFDNVTLRDLRGNNIPIDRRAQALRPYSNGFCPQCRGELRSPKRGANCVRPKGTLSKRKSLNATSVPEPSSLLGFITLGGLMLGGAVRLTGGGSDT